MNQLEAEKFLTIMQKSYPTIFRDKNFDPEGFAIQSKMWGSALYDYTFQECLIALDIWFSTEVNSPQPVHLKTILRKCMNPNSVSMSPESAWELVTLAVKKYGSHNSDKAFKTFTEQIKRAVRNVGGWQHICETPLGTKWDFLRKNFMEVYNEFGRDEKEQALLPSTVLQRIQEMQQLRLGQGE